MQEEALVYKKNHLFNFQIDCHRLSEFVKKKVMLNNFFNVDETIFSSYVYLKYYNALFICVQLYFVKLKFYFQDINKFPF